MDYDVVIVGGGPAGTITALALAESWPRLAGRTLLVEAAAHPRSKPCGGVMSGRALAVVERLVGPLLTVPHLSVRRVEVRHGSQRRGHTLPRPALAVDRSAFDAVLMTAVRRGPVTVRESTRLVGLERRSLGWVAILRGPEGTTEITARVIVGADGALGAVRRLAGLPRGMSRARLALTERPVHTLDPPADTMVFELPEDARWPGYYWNFPAPRVGGHVVRSHGVFHHGRHPPQPLGRLLAQRISPVLGSARGPGLGPGSGLAPAPVSAVQRLYQPGLPCAAPGVGLVGEGLGADPLSGEGIAQAIGTGVRAAAQLWSIFERQDFRLRNWSRRVLGPDARVLGQNALVAMLAYGPGQGWITRRVMASPVLADLALRRFCGVGHSAGSRWAERGCDPTPLVQTTQMSSAQSAGFPWGNGERGPEPRRGGP